MGIHDDFLADIQLTHEMIFTQTNVSFIKDIRERVTYIKDVITKNDLRNAALFSDGYVEARKSLEEISDILTKRFGVNIKLFIGNDMCASTSTITPGSFNILMGSNDWHEGLKKYFGNKKAAVFKDPKDFVDASKNLEDYYNILYKNVLAMERDLDKFNITFNSKEATITGLPKDFLIVLKIDLCYYLNAKGRNLTPDEFIAIILHEYGHNYTSLEKTYYSIKNSVTLMEAVRETISNGIKDEVTILKVVNKKLGGSVVNGNNVQLLASVYEKYTGQYGDDKHGQISRLSSEQQADLFVSRFGLGGALGDALTKDGVWVRYFNREMDNSWETAVWSSTLSLVGTTIISTAGGLTMASIGILALFTAGWGLLMAALLTTYIKAANNFFKKENKYELDQFRLLRIKQDTIRQIRLLDQKADKELIKKLLSNIDILDKKISYILETQEIVKKSSYLKKILIDGQIDKDTKSILDMNNLVQDLMENNLHTKYVRF